jgi:LPPG:FO 2-phospho-L-lactate transferase
MMTVLTGGTGGAKLIEGLILEIDPDGLVIVCNTADDSVLHGLYISPDTDTIMYTLAGLSDDRQGWGIRGDTFTVLEQLENYGCSTWFKLGDRDLATHILRTKLMRQGLSLAQATETLCRSLGVATKVIPMSDDRVETRIATADGDISFQEYFVKQKWHPEVRRVSYSGVATSRPAPGVLHAIREASAVIICPSNPVTSIGPILAVPGVRAALRETAAPVVAVSPMIGDTAISGPAHKLMAAQGFEASAYGIARGYADFLGAFVVDYADSDLKPRIAALGLSVHVTSIRMASVAEKRRLAREVLALVE